MPPLFEIVERQPIPGSRFSEVGDMMHERRNQDRFRSALEPGLRPLILTERMKFANEKTPGVCQNARSFGKNEGQVLDVFQHQIADNEIERPLFTRPWSRDVGDDEMYMVGSQFRFGLMDHTFRKVEGADFFSDLSQQGCVLAGAAADLQDRFAAQIRQAGLSDDLIEITRQVAIRIIGG